MRPRPNPFEKRKKELARKEKQKKKAERRDERERSKAERGLENNEEDPDIAGIVPGPQPPVEAE
jgi:hypothetical protein